MKLGLLICTYNRPQYLAKCLESVKNANLPEGTKVLIVDDASTDKETIQLILSSGYDCLIKSENRSIKDSMLVGCDHLFRAGCKLVTNLDGDAIVKPDFATTLIDLHVKFPGHIITGFNCRTKNKNGSERHKVVNEGEGFNKKKSVGGINMMFDQFTYQNFILPSLLTCLQSGGNWDHKSCLLSEASGFLIVCAVPSVVQHIGIESSMGHSEGGEPPDVADDFYYSTTVPESYESQRQRDKNAVLRYKGVNVFITQESLDKMEKFQAEVDKQTYLSLLYKLKLQDVTLVGADCVDVQRLITAIDKCCEDIEFGDVKILSSLQPENKRVTQIKHLGTKGEYSDFMMKELANYIDTKYMLVVQHDGYILNAAAWDDSWREYDYIGAPWEWYKDGMNVGNGGFSFRSKKIMQITANDRDIFAIDEPGVTRHREEDHCICRIFRRYLEQEYKMKFAPIEVARKFSIEGWNSPNKTWNGEFGFHGPHADISKAIVK